MTEALQAQDKRLTNIFFKQDGKILMDFVIKATANFETVVGIFENTLLSY